LVAKLENERNQIPRKDKKPEERKEKEKRREIKNA
jgi:hypothetical protein